MTLESKYCSMVNSVTLGFTTAGRPGGYKKDFAPGTPLEFEYITELKTFAPSAAGSAKKERIATIP
jgi:hypothetical protein